MLLLRILVGSEKVGQQTFDRQDGELGVALELKVHRIARSLLAKRCPSKCLWNQGHREEIIADLHHGEAHAVHSDPAFRKQILPVRLNMKKRKYEMKRNREK